MNREVRIYSKNPEKWTEYEAAGLRWTAKYYDLKRRRLVAVEFIGDVETIRKLKLDENKSKQAEVSRTSGLVEKSNAR